MQYEFEKYTGAKFTSEDMTYAIPALFAILATLVTGDDEEKQNKLYELIDKAIKINEGTTSEAQIAIVGQFAKMAISGKQ
ncbi:hypothetical protein Q4R25_17950 [Morganella morganii]